jgi:DNA-binding transcriptional LysR family regulator
MIGRGGITYHQLHTFLTVARTGSLTKAARELNASQPTVSLQLHALRDFLGAPLFERPGGSFRLTPAGEKLRRYGDDVLGGLRALRQEVEALKGSIAGPLAVGLTYAMSRYLLPSALSRFRRQFHDVDLQLHVEAPEMMFASLLANRVDLACYIRLRTPPGLIVEPLRDEEFVIVVSPQHPLARRRRVVPRQLNDQPFIGFRSSLFTELLTTKLREAGVTPQIGAEGRHHEAVKKLVEANAGYSILVRPSVMDELAAGRLVALPLSGPPIRGELVAAYQARLASPLVREFIRFARAELNTTREPERRPAGRPAPNARTTKRR